jgi:predicted phage terminase large subunit-like protein
MTLVLNGKRIKVSEHEYQVFLRSDFHMFIERSFHALNPQTRFLSNWHIEKIAQELEKVRSGKTRRLIINVPPRSLKSHCASIAFPAWILGHNPSAKIICASYGQELADTLAGNCRTLISGSWYRGLFPTRLSPKKQAVHDFHTTEHGVRMATSVGGVLTGRGADILIIDDPLKPEEAASETQRNTVNDWYDHTVVTRLDDKRKGSIVIIMQRLHEDDLVGHVQEKEDWKVLRFPAIAEEDEKHVIRSLGGRRTVRRKAGEALHPEREPLDVLNAIRRSQGEYHFAGQYQQAPAPLDGGIVKMQWLRFYAPQELPTFEYIFQSWDTANKSEEINNFSVCTTWGVAEKQHLYLLDVFRERLEYPELKRAVKRQAQDYLVKFVVIEDKASGTQLLQDLRYEGFSRATAYESIGDKIMRMYNVTPTIEGGFVHLPKEAGWLGLYLHELAVFPKGKYDDQVDSTSQALGWMGGGRWKNGMGIFEYYRRLDQELKANPNHGVPRDPPPPWEMLR